LCGSDYAIIALDLRDTEAMSEKLKHLEIDFTVPTLVFAECVLIYLPSKKSDEIIKYFATAFENIYFMNWEMMKLNDQFGKVMIKNFEVLKKNIK
jgi:O-methyltransferase involved in polyketide biosynthesis